MHPGPGSHDTLPGTHGNIHLVGRRIRVVETLATMPGDQTFEEDGEGVRTTNTAMNHGPRIATNDRIHENQQPTRLDAISMLSPCFIWMQKRNVPKDYSTLTYDGTLFCAS